MENSLLTVLARVTLAASCAIVLVLLARRHVRARLGARTAYHLWMLVPALMLAAAVPSLQVSRQIVVQAVPAVDIARLAAPVAATAQLTWSGMLLTLWLLGALAAALLFVHAHRRYGASLGSLAAHGDAFMASTSAQGPALLGLWRPRIVLPADFRRRYSADEQALIITHERRHAERGDPMVNAFIALLQCTFWFNPLMHLAAARCRFDQELACDADVMARHAGKASAYAAAMLKTEVGGGFAPATCHWQSSHPLKERIMQLHQTPLNRTRRLTGRFALAALICTGMLGTLAVRAEPALGPTYMVAFKMTARGKTIEPKLMVRGGEPFSVAYAQDVVDWKGDFLVTPDKDGSVWLKSQFTIDGKKSEGIHNGGMPLGGSEQVRIVSDDGKSVLIDMHASVSLVPESPPAK